MADLEQMGKIRGGIQTRQLIHDFENEKFQTQTQPEVRVLYRGLCLQSGLLQNPARKGSGVFPCRKLVFA